MQIVQLKNIHTWVRSASNSEVLFVSALILPFYVTLYAVAFNQINESYKNCGIVAGVIVYTIGIVWMKHSQSNDEQNSRDLAIIRTHIVDRGYEFMSFERLLEIDSAYDESRVRELIFAFPNDIRLAILKEKKRGIKVLNIEKEDPGQSS